MPRSAPREISPAVTWQLVQNWVWLWHSLQELSRLYAPAGWVVRKPPGWYPGGASAAPGRWHSRQAGRAWQAAQVCGRAEAGAAWVLEKSRPWDSGRRRLTWAPLPRSGAAAGMAWTLAGEPTWQVRQLSWV